MKRIQTVAACLLGLLTIDAALACDFSWRGQEVQGGLIFGFTEPGANVTVDKRSVRVSADGAFLLGFGRDETEPRNVNIVCADGAIATHSFRPKSREYAIQKITGVPQRTVTPSEAHLKRIRSENAQIGRARKLDDARTDFLQDFIWPVEGPITGVYGSQRVYNGKPRRPHFGVDVAAPVGTLVVAPSDGLITLAHPDMFYSGGTVFLDHGHGLSSAFLHMDTVTVTKGQKVKQGDPIGTVGAKGRATGPHLDWRMNLFRTRLDVELFMPTRPDQN